MKERNQTNVIAQTLLGHYDPLILVFISYMIKGNFESILYLQGFPQRLMFFFFALFSLTLTMNSYLD